jgi:acylphosphatase
MKSYSIVVSGVVQGVFYRASAKVEADRLSLRGFARNEKDGSVYIEVSGEDTQLENFFDWCRHGPPRAVVDNCAIKNIPLKDFKEFEIRKS